MLSFQPADNHYSANSKIVDSYTNRLQLYNWQIGFC